LGKTSVIEVQLGDQVEKEMSVLFVDIRGFTAISETMTPQENFNFINAYLEKMEPIIGKNHGFIDKYIGDAIMALFPEKVDHAVQAAIAILKTLNEYNCSRIQKGRSPLKVGIGVHTGMLMLGTVGGRNRMDGTVISDAVNVASRVEGLTKMYGTPLLITEQTYQQLEDPTQYHIRVIDRVQVKGKSQLVTVYEVFDADPSEVVELKLTTLNDFNQGFTRYHQQKEGDDWRPFFEKVLKINPYDESAKIYLKRLG
jgi:class 3 adenylate cyclase